MKASDKYLCLIFASLLTLLSFESLAQSGNSYAADKIYSVAEVMPVFPGGEEAMIEFIAGSIRYPEEAKANKVEGTVYVSTVIETNGTVMKPELIKGIGNGCNEEALRVVSLMPNWTPGRQKGKTVRVRVTLPVEFKIQETKKAEDNYALGLKAAQDGNFEEAIKYFSLDIDKNPDHLNAIYNRGASYFRISQTEKACADWIRVMELGDTSVASMIEKYCNIKRDSIPVKAAVNVPPPLTHGDSLYKLALAAFDFPKHEVYIQGSVLFPTGVYGEEYNPSVSNSTAEESITRNMEGEIGGFGASTGFAAEIGEYFYYNNNPVQTAGGLRVTFLSFGLTPFSWGEDTNYIFSDAEYKTMYTFGMKLGPCLRHILHKNWVMRLYYQFCFNINSRAEWYYDDNNNYSYYTEYNGQQYRITYTNDNASFKSGTGLGIKHELGGNLSYRNFLFGVSFNFGKVSYKSVHYQRNTDIEIDEYFPQTGHYQHYGTVSSGDDRKFKVKAPSAYFLLSLGVLF